MSERVASGSVLARAASAAARRIAASAGEPDVALLELVPEPALAVRLPAGEVLGANAALARFLDLDAELFRGAAATDLADVVHPEDLDRALAMLRLVRREGDAGAVQLACRVRPRTGPWWSTRLAFAVAELPGEAAIVVVVARSPDAAGGALVERPDGTWVLDEGTEGAVTLEGDARWAALCGEPVPRTLDEWCARLAPAGARALRGRIGSVLHGLAEAVVVDVEAAGGRRFRVRAREAGPGRVVGSVLPLDPPGADAGGWALELVEALGDGVALVREGIVTWAGAGGLLGPGAELVGSAVLEWVHPDDMAALAELLRRGRGRAALRVVPVGGGPVAVEVEALPLASAGEATTALVLRRAGGAGDVRALLDERRRILGPLLAGLAHEINNPLAWLVLSLDALDEDLAGMDPLVAGLAAASTAPERAEAAGAVVRRWGEAAFGECLRDARDGARRVEEIVAELRAVSGAGREPDLARLVAIVTRLVHPRIRYEAPAGEAGPRVGGPAGRVGELVLALALVGADLGGEPARFELGERDGRARLRVGSGRPPPHDARLRRELGICRLLAEELGGELVEGRGPDGWWVEARLPLRRGGEEAPGRAPRLLVVDDEPVFRRRLAAALGAGFAVEQAASGAEARDRLAGGAPVDLLVTDLVMPGSSGEELLDWVRAHRPALLSRTVVVSGGASPELERRLRDDLGVPVLRKPVDVGALRELLGRLVGGERRAAPRARRPHLGARLAAGDAVEIVDVVDVSTRGIRLAPVAFERPAGALARVHLALLLPGSRDGMGVDAELVRVAEDGGPCFRLRWPDEEARRSFARWLELEET